MRYEWDVQKDFANRAKHGVPFEDVADFEWESSLETFDSRKDYKELRMIAMSTIRGRLHVLVYTLRSNSVRVISLRKANDREIGNYEEVKAAIQAKTTGA